MALLHKFFEIIETLPEDLKAKTKEDFTAWYEIESWVQKFEARKTNYEQIAAWANGANDDKNKGFYVDLKDGKWITPKSFAEEKYEKESQYTDVMIDFVKGMEKVFADIERFIKGRKAK